MEYDYSNGCCASWIDQEEIEWNWFLENCGSKQRLWVRVTLPVVRMSAKWVMLHLRSEPRWSALRWKSKT